MKRHPESSKCSSSSVIQLNKDVDQVNVDVHLDTMAEITNNNKSATHHISSSKTPTKSDVTIDTLEEDEEESCCKCCSAGYTSESQSITSIQVN